MIGEGDIEPLGPGLPLLERVLDEGTPGQAPDRLPCVDAPARPHSLPHGHSPGRLGLLLCRVNSDPPAQLRLLHGDRLVASYPARSGGAWWQLSWLQVAVASQHAAPGDSQ